MSIETGHFLFHLRPDTTKSILVTILGASAALMGFVIIYLTIAFEKYKKGFGEYAFQIFKSDINIWGIVILLIAEMLITLIALLDSDSGSQLFLALFNISCVYFSIILVFTIPFGRNIISGTNAVEYCRLEMCSLTPDQFIDHEQYDNSPLPIHDVIKRRANNRTIFITEIIYSNIRERNNFDGLAVIKLFYNWVELSLRVRYVDDKHKNVIVSTYIDILENASGMYLLNKDEFSIRAILEIILSVNNEIISNNLTASSIEKVFNISQYMARTSIEAESESLVWEALWSMFHVYKSQVEQNLPKDDELWHGEPLFEDSTLRAEVPGSELKHKKFDAIDMSTTIEFPDIFERLFLCKNYFIVEKSIGVYSSFIQTLIRSDLESSNKLNLSGSLNYSFTKFLLRFQSEGVPHKFNYLNYHISIYTILDAVKYSFDLGTEIFSSYWDYAERSADKGLLIHKDVEDISGLCRLIISYSNEIHHPDTYVAKIVKLHDKYRKYLLNQIQTDVSQRERKELVSMVELINSDLRSFITYSQRPNIKNTNFIPIISPFLPTN